MKGRDGPITCSRAGQLLCVFAHGIKNKINLCNLTDKTIPSSSKMVIKGVFLMPSIPFFPPFFHRMAFFIGGKLSEVVHFKTYFQNGSNQVSQIVLYMPFQGKFNTI